MLLGSSLLGFCCLLSVPAYLLLHKTVAHIQEQIQRHYHWSCIGIEKSPAGNVSMGFVP